MAAVTEQVKQDIEENGLDEEIANHCACIVQASVDDYEEGLLSTSLDNEVYWAISPILRHASAPSSLPVSSISTIAKRAVHVAHSSAVGSADEVSELLVRCEGIILAFAGKVLLRKSSLRLKRGHVHAVVGQNGCGKTTLMRRLRSKDINNFPQYLSVVYVEDPSHASGGLGEWVSDFANPNADAHGSLRALEKAGFTADMREKRIGELSGGWRMKAAIVRALQQAPSLLLLDEPTNHLDSGSVDWLVGELKQTPSTVVVVSHDYEFLEEVAYDIIHFEDMQLHYYPGGFKRFREERPDVALPRLKENRSMSNLHDGTDEGTDVDHNIGMEANGNGTDTRDAAPRTSASAGEGSVSSTTASVDGDLSSALEGEPKVEINLPDPGPLEGVKSKKKPVITFNNVTFRYPGMEQPVLNGASFKVAPSSRIAITGPNAAGKSTVLKLVIGENENDPEQGDVWKHHNLRVAYVAQHSAHHLQQSVERTPIQYVQDRFYAGRDKELAKLKSVQLSEEEEALRHERGNIRDVVGMQKKGGSLQYEVVKNGRKEGDTVWEPLEFLQRSHDYVMKLVRHYDEKLKAMSAGLDVRPITTDEILKHLADYDISEDLARQKIRRLSGGQKSRLVLAAAMWTKPHILALDEPTNFLDQETLGALVSALKRFKGGFLCVTHNEQFVREVCKEKWEVAEGEVTASSSK